MFRPSTILVCAFLAGAAATPASAQVPTLPETSRAQGQANSINQSLANQSENRAVQQQNQFELNAIRNTPPVQPIAPPVVVPNPIR